MVIVLFNARLVVQHQPGQVLCPLEAGHKRHAAHRSILFDLKMFLRNADCGISLFRDVICNNKV